MKKLLIIALACLVLCAFAGCAESPADGNPPVGGSEAVQPEEKPIDPPEEEKPDETVQPEEKPNEPSEEKPGEEEPDGEKEITAMYLYINGNKIEVTLAKNKAVDALVEILKKGDIAYTADDYGGFEKVGALGHSLPTENSQITTVAGDVILYSGNQIVLFYGSNSWSYTRLGKINGYSVTELRTLLGAGKGRVQIKISLK